jgi:hypothetical protein
VSQQHWFIDETKQRSYLMVASAHRGDELDELRKLIRGLVLKGQRRVHMAKESDPRRRAIAAALCGAGVTATIYDAPRGDYPHEQAARAACLAALITDASHFPDVSLVLERDDSLLAWDRRRLYQLTHHLENRVRYSHQRAAQEQLLAIPDAIAWCWARGGDWRRRIAPVISDVRRL